MNRDKSLLPKSGAWWRHHLSAREIIQAEKKKNESLAKLNFPFLLPFGAGEMEFIIGCSGMCFFFIFLARLLNLINDRLGSSILKRHLVFWVFAFHDLV